MKEIKLYILQDWEALYAFLAEKNAENKTFSSRFFNELLFHENYLVSSGIWSHIKKNVGCFRFKDKCIERINECRERLNLDKIVSFGEVEISPMSLLSAARYCLIQKAKESGESPEELFKKYKVDI